MRTLAHKHTPQEAWAKSSWRPGVAPAHHLGFSAPMLQTKLSCPCDGGCPRCTGVIQPKLIIGQPGDRYEQEADRVADRVMRMPAPTVQPKPTSGGSLPSCEEEGEEPLLQTKPLAEQITPLVQRQEAESGEEEREEEEEIPLQAKGEGSRPPEIHPNLESRLRALQGGGQPLPWSVRAFFEPRFGCDFSQVRVHTDMQGEASSRRLNARAFTIGHHIVFGPGQYAPGTITGRKLLAHELAHTMQQDRGLVVHRQTPAPIGRDEFASRFNDEFRTVLHALEPDAPGGQLSPERLERLFTMAQREKLADFMVTRRIPERLFNGADDIGHANAQQRILISAHIITHGTYRPGSFEQRVHARYCGHWVQIVHQYAGVTPASGSWPERIAGRAIMGSFDPMGVPVFGAGQAQTIFGGVRASAEELPIPEGTGHARTREREEEQLVDDPTARRRVHRRTQFGMERFDELQAGDWLYLYNANESATGQHSVIFSRWVGAGDLEGIPYRQAIVFNQPRPESGGREQTLLLGDQFTPGQRANAEQGIPYCPQIDAITLVVRLPLTARPASTPAELLPSPSAPRAERLAEENNRYIQAQERRLRRTVDRNRLKQWLRNENRRFIASLGELVTAREQVLLTEANRSTQIETLVRLYQRLRALSVNAALAEQSRRSTEERVGRTFAEAQSRLDELREQVGPELADIDARLAAIRARVGEFEHRPTASQIRELRAELRALERRIQRLSRGEELTRLRGERGELRTSIRGLERQRQAERTELRTLRRQIAILQRRQATIQRQVSVAEGRLPFGLLPGRVTGQDPGTITGRLRDLSPSPPWSDLVVQSTPTARQGGE